MISDYRNVGYANTMLRPSPEVYGQVTVDSLDGADVTWQGSIGETTVTAQLAVGGATAPIASNGEVVTVRTTDTRVLTVSAEHGPLTLRASRAVAKVSVSGVAGLNGLVAGLRAVGSGYRIAALNEQADILEIDKKKAVFTSAGAMLDWNNVLFNGEYTVRKSDRFAEDTRAWYVMAGYRIGKVLPYIAHGRTWADQGVDNIVPTSCPAAYGPACTPTVQALRAGVAQINRNTRQSTDTVGVRWDAFRSAALKFQIDRVKPEGGPGLLLSTKPGFTGPVTVGAVAIDFVF
jgi:hypothetical protein